jgi:hypothetical protein
MSMSGKRFGIGLVAGLLLGLVVVGASTGFGFTYGAFGSFTAAPVSSITSQTTQSTYPKAAATNTTTTMVTSTVPTFGSSNSSVLAVTSTTSTANLTAAQALVPSHHVPSYSSRINNIAGQPVLTNAVVLLPVVVAILLGAMLYAASSRSRAKESPEAPAPG